MLDHKDKAFSWIIQMNTIFSKKRKMFLMLNSVSIIIVIKNFVTLYLKLFLDFLSNKQR